MIRFRFWSKSSDVTKCIATHPFWPKQIFQHFECLLTFVSTNPSKFHFIFAQFGTWTIWMSHWKIRWYHHVLVLHLLKKNIICHMMQCHMMQCHTCCTSSNAQCTSHSKLWWHDSNVMNLNGISREQIWGFSEKTWLPSTNKRDCQSECVFWWRCRLNAFSDQQI